MNRVVWIDGERVKLEPSALVGQGGEAEVYDLGDGRVVKWWKPADHPDFDGLPAAQAAAKERLAIGASKLRALPALPVGVVAPSGLALAKKAGAVVGYVMPKVSGVPLHSYGEPKWRRDNAVDGADVVAALVALHDAIAGLHRAGIVVGDCNDLNVLVDGRRVHLIDVDSYQFGAFGCSMFSERFVDPRLCDAQALFPTKPHDRESDWFAFATMAFRTLLGVGPWGGVHQPKDIATRCPPTMRALRRLWVLAKDVVYPRAARPASVLPDELVEVFRSIFEGDQRGVFPRTELERLRLRRCSTCGEEHGRVRCPACTTVAHMPPSIVHGRLTWRVIDAREIVFAGREITAQTTPVWIAGDALMRETRLGPERIGSVMQRQTRAWASDKLGVGFYRAGGYAVGFVFRPDRGVLDDRVKLPKLRGQLVDAHATIGADRSWLWFTTVDAGRLVVTCVVVGADAQVVATETLADAPWVAGIAGACAAGPNLFVPTDDGIARVEIVQGTITQTRTFAETAPLVSSSDRLALNNTGGIDVGRRRDALRLTLQ